ncbi:MAG TPA: hypothetical protein VIT92_03430, partial [Burkholderiaceae bacterium]
MHHRSTARAQARRHPLSRIALFGTPLLLAALLAGLAANSRAADPAPTAKPAPTMADLLKAAPASDWRALDPENTLYMDLPGGRVVIELAAPF